MKVRKMFLKPLATLMAVCMLAQLSSVSFAVENDAFTEIVVEGVDGQKTQLIADTITGKNSTSTFQAISPASILCIFSHSMAQTTARETNHRFWATAPRCRQTTYRVDYCTRSSCNHMILTQISQSRISCCS
ncbi:MAG: hypothetical protein LBD23_19620 [Oscillospiraceae bacterium]|jgi:hypothetical protein|nr:hypothetical protein [Oscillospiraceae bacterium]